MYLTTAIKRAHFHCRLLLRGVNKANHYHIPKANVFTRDGLTLANTKQLAPTPKRSELKNIQSRYEYTRRLLVDNVLKRVTNTLAADLRRRSARQLFNGNPSPFFALIGVSLASGTGLVKHDAELESVCWEIREAIYRIRNNLREVEESDFDETSSINSLEFGSVIAKGSFGIVYEARERPKTENLKYEQSLSSDDFPLAVKMMFNYEAESNSTAILRSMYRELVPLHCDPTGLSNFLGNDKLYGVLLSNLISALLRIVISSLMEEIFERVGRITDRIQRLPPHVNIVKMYRSFTDYVPELPDSRTLCPNALPQRLDPQGFGRNMSLFLVMKKYNTDLKQYLSKRVPRTRDCILLLTQLLEAVCHINKHGIAHRDLKSDNILLDTSDGEENCPLLAVTDFGSCLSDKYYGLNLPYKTPDVDKGGNAALMAPEVVSARAGMFASIDYSKADTWTAGTVAYEIFSGRNPFFRYRNQATEVLRSATYTEEMLPNLPDQVPPLIARLIRNLLVRDPVRRLDAETAATVCQVYLWAPSQWLQNDRMPSNTEILQWLLSLTTKVLYEGPLVHQQSKEKRPSSTEYELIATFLSRIRLNIVRRALDWIYNSP